MEHCRIDDGRNKGREDHSRTVSPHTLQVFNEVQNASSCGNFAAFTAEAAAGVAIVTPASSAPKRRNMFGNLAIGEHCLMMMDLGENMTGRTRAAGLAATSSEHDPNASAKAYFASGPHEPTRATSVDERIADKGVAKSLIWPQVKFRSGLSSERQLPALSGVLSGTAIGLLVGIPEVDTKREAYSLPMAFDASWIALRTLQRTVMKS